MAALLDDGDARRRLGPVDLVPRRRPARPAGAVAGRRAATSSTRCSTSIQRAGRGLVEFVPGLLGADPEIAHRGPGPPLRRPRHPAHVDRLRLLRQQPGEHPEVDRPGATSSPPRASGFYPQLSPRTVDFRLNWDSSMMFMSMPEGWHKVIAARGDDQGGAARRPGVAGRRARRVGPHREGDVPPPPARDGALRRGLRRRERAVARAHARRSRRRARRPSVRRASPTSCSPTTAGPASSRSASPTPTSTASPARSPIPAVLDQLVRRRRAHADAVRVGRHHAAAHPPRPRARRLHARAGGATS